LEKVSVSKGIKGSWVKIKENIKISAQESLGLHERKKHKPWFDAECAVFLDKRKHAKIQWLQNPNQSNGDNLKDIRREASRHFRNKKEEHLKAKINELETNSKNKNIRDLYWGNNDFNILGGSIHTINENTKALVAASREIGLEVNAEKTKYMVMSRDQNAGKSHNIKIDNKPFEREEDFKYFGTTLTNRNSIHEEIKSRFTSGNACYHSVQNLFPSKLLSKNTKIKVCGTINLPVVLYGYETWSLTLQEEKRLRVFENRVLRRIFEPKWDEVRWDWGRLHNEELNNLYASPNIFWVFKSRRM
jgi:hypothetical protein